jgi:predicted RNase H-like HicB family nuclease
MRYLVVVESGPDSRGIVSYSAFSPDVLGCVATGKTREEVERRMQSALEAHIAWMLSDGDPLPEPHTSPDDPEIADDPTLTPIYLDIRAADLAA